MTDHDGGEVHLESDGSHTVVNVSLYRHEKRSMSVTDRWHVTRERESNARGGR